MGETIKTVLLAVFQGVAEFLPISSSAHIAVIGKWMELGEIDSGMETALHFGTFLSVLAFYRRQVLALILDFFSQTIKRPKTVPFSLSFSSFAIIVGCIPAAVAGLLFDDALDEAFADPPLRLIGAMLMVTGLALVSILLARRDQARRIGLGKAVIIGLAQALALIPGISRSGATIVCARHLGISQKDAVDFSFIVSLPLILGATLLPLARSISSTDGIQTGAIANYALAAGGAAVTGYIALRLLYRFLCGRRFWIFGIYCLLAGVGFWLLA